LTEATRAVAAPFGVEIVRRRPREPVSRKVRNKARQARRRERAAAQRAAALGE
jgi:hypothetical protein